MREFLKGLELEKDVIDSIMAEHGKQITSYKEKISNLETNVSNLKDEIKNNESTIKELNGTIEEKDKSLENLQTITNEKNDLQAQLKIKDSNVKKEFLKFVKSEVMDKIDDKNDFDTVLKSYKEENPQYFGETVVKNVQTSPNLQAKSTQNLTTNEIINDMIRGK